MERRGERERERFLREDGLRNAINVVHDRISCRDTLKQGPRDYGCCISYAFELHGSYFKKLKLAGVCCAVLWLCDVDVNEAVFRCCQNGEWIGGLANCMCGALVLVMGEMIYGTSS